MYTRCPECDSSHYLNAALLAQSRGRVRCGRCGCRFDALESLFDEWPDLADQPPPAGSRYRPPVLGAREDLPMPFGPATVHTPKAESRRPVWLAVTVVLILATLAHGAWAFRTHLLGLPQVEKSLAQLGLVTPAGRAVHREPAAIRVVSRDLHSHPTLAGVLVLSATFVNGAMLPQAWPILELTLLNVQGEPVARRRFRAVEYLNGKHPRENVLPPGTHVPVLLEFASPGQTAVGFEIAFY